jgi:hypothetical protein
MHERSTRADCSNSPARPSDRICAQPHAKNREPAGIQIEPSARAPAGSCVERRRDRSNREACGTCL